MKIAIDIGGCISKYPELFRQLIDGWNQNPSVEVHVITDMHDRGYTLENLATNNIPVPPERVHNANYAKYGEMSKAILLKKLGIDILIDDFPGYMVWDPRLGPAPIRMQVQPDPYRPYWSKTWITRSTDGEFGRRVCPPFEEVLKEFESKRTHDESTKED
jgi:hypothetical protein